VPGKWHAPWKAENLAQILNWEIPLVNAHHDVLFEEKPVASNEVFPGKPRGIEFRHTGVLHTQLHDYVAGGAPFFGMLMCDAASSSPSQAAQKLTWLLCRDNERCTHVGSFSSSSLFALIVCILVVSFVVPFYHPR